MESSVHVESPTAIDCLSELVWLNEMLLMSVEEINTYSIQSSTKEIK